MKARTNQAFRMKKKEFYERFKDKAMTSGNITLYYKAVKGLKDRNKPKEFDIMSLCPEKTVQEVGEEVADYFSAISANFDPLTHD